MGGWKIIETMGLRITTLHANSGAAANLGASASIFGATAMGVPISTTHAAASSVVGAGIGSGKGANWRVVGEMVLAWVITIPAASIVAYCVYWTTQLPTLLAWIVVVRSSSASGPGRSGPCATASTPTTSRLRFPPSRSSTSSTSTGAASGRRRSDRRWRGSQARPAQA